MASSRLPVYAAMAANVAIAVTKFIVAAITGSAAMLSEAIHSAVDTFNSVLLLLGMRLSKRPASEEHPFGHGKELYFWSLIVAMLIFALGGGVSIYQGVERILHPEPIRDVLWSYLVLGAAAVFEGASFLISLRQFLQQLNGRPFWQALHNSKDPGNYMVLAEDSAALGGLAIAATGIFLATTLGIPELDGAASVLVGVLLAGVALLLIRESRGLLIGEGLRPESARTIRAMALEHDDVRVTGPVLSMYIGPDNVLVVMELNFAPGTSTDQAARTIASIERDVQKRFPMVKRLYLEVASREQTVAHTKKRKRIRRSG
jgi:cation diffusion facilitator family transporter